MDTELPRILSPNLGCPVILSPEELESAGFDVVMAQEKSSAADQLALIARPSFAGEGEEFLLELKDGEELTERTLPPLFERVEETRFLISTVLHSFVFAGKARFFRYRARLTSPIFGNRLRWVGNEPRATLYNIFLKMAGRDDGSAYHALCLQPEHKDLRFIHLTDLHTALRNDLYEDNLTETITYPPSSQVSEDPFNNFNDNLRLFIRFANELADQGELDFVLILGDLVDFMYHGFHQRNDYGDNNLRVFRNLILGEGNEAHRLRPNPGLKVPIFTSTGNHDWRFFPYDVAVHQSVFRVKKEIAKQFDLFWADEQEEITQKLEAAYYNLRKEGSPISNRTRLGKLINWGLRTLEQWQVQLLTPLSASVVAGILPKIPWIGGYLHELLGSYDPLLTSGIALLVLPVLMGILTGFIRKSVHNRIIDLLAIEAGWQALQDYFLTVNPYFNYAFRMGPNHFLILDTGHDCLRAQYLWDGGDKKLGPLSIHDNTIGQSPDTMAFYDINEYYPYSQITWIDRLMQLITQEARAGNQSVRTFIGLHAPPASLSKEKRKEAERESRDKPEGLLLEKKRFNIRYGTINHFLSQFFHLCLGRIEKDPASQRYLPVDMVLAGHAHWKLEFRLAWDRDENRPLVYFGDFTGNSAYFQNTFEQSRPFLLQTPPCGPRDDFSPDPPYFRFIEIDGQGKVTKAEVLALRADGTAGPAQFPPP